jgi:diketogulonate reductase-like aldo/keto reductase
MTHLADLTLRGVQVPRFLYGTAWKEERTEALTAQALRLGFRGIDTANQRKHYFEAAVGAAVKAELSRGALRREELFLQSKFTFASGQDQRLPYDPAARLATQVEQSFASTLQHFDTTYLDSYVLHGPTARSGFGAADWEVWRAMEGLQQRGGARLLGVSNVSLAQLRTLHQAAAVKPAFVQNRCYARSGWDRELRAFCRDSDMVYQGFSLLTANRAELSEAAVSALARRMGCSAAELVFRFALQVGMLPLTGSSSPEHLLLDLGCLNFELTPSEVATLEKLGG